MTYIKNGKIVLDGTIKECDLEEKLLRALEIIVDKEVNIHCLIYSNTLKEYNDTFIKQYKLTQEQYDSLKEIIK